MKLKCQDKRTNNSVKSLRKWCTSSAEKQCSTAVLQGTTWNTSNSDQQTKCTKTKPRRRAELPVAVNFAGQLKNLRATPCLFCADMVE